MSIWIWLGIIVVFVILEAVTYQLVSMWFIVGSLAAFVASLFGAPSWLQWAIFAGVSLVSLFLVRPLVKKKISPKITPTNADSAIGKVAVTTLTIDNKTGAGRVLVDGQDWAAHSRDDSIIKKGEHVVVHAIEGVRLIVSRTKP